ncbi:hypothetical protein AAZX31_07G211100 [Glycine max]|uniref:uncharacterized protein n=1 Tax=Glycine max TaxID=3847 RepID=UPI001B357EEC|nr:uncharacterized protein LOC100804751 [Glycine max]KAG5010927.1 hypothetical protein JHK87_019442 [Glycine soja]KAG4401242.1 hypothetical protein GLYMA_07G227750v4 [Glycine max]KAG5023664.1 hypothetical protein JHK85_020006 [Glycine max]KAG5038740.1 hypothetical protein JHK86_019580 [Glycine max]KAG5143870.1 hypothetical protein JHK82_019565 [Glycine max]
MAAAATNLNLWGILLESKRIINAHSRHFLALSVIFLLPLSFSLIVSPFLFPLLSPHHSSHIHILLRQTQPQPLTLTLTETPPPLLPFPFSFPLLFFLLFVVFFSLFALASITHSVFHGFFGRPVKLLPALLSILTSFLPLLATSVLTHLLLLSLSLPTIFLFSTASSPPILLAISAVLVLFAVVYLRVSWTLAPVVAVVESTWGLQSLCRSAALTKGMRPLAASCFLFFASMQALLLWTASVDGWAWKDWAFVVQIVLTSTLLMLLMLYNAAADTVLYMYCKAVHGELALEIAEEFAWQYVCLPFDDGKVPHVVSVVRV